MKWRLWRESKRQKQKEVTDWLDERQRGRGTWGGKVPAEEKRQRTVVLCSRSPSGRPLSKWSSQFCSHRAELWPKWQPLTEIPACRKLDHWTPSAPWVFSSFFFFLQTESQMLCSPTYQPQGFLKKNRAAFQPHKQAVNKSKCGS